MSMGNGFSSCSMNSHLSRFLSRAAAAAAALDSLRRYMRSQRGRFWWDQRRMRSCARQTCRSAGYSGRH